MPVTLEAIVKELQKVPVDRLEETYQFVHQMASTRPANNEDIIQQGRELMGAFADWSAEDWDDFDAELKRTRQELFNRPAPEL